MPRVAYFECRGLARFGASSERHAARRANKNNPVVSFAHGRGAWTEMTTSHERSVRVAPINDWRAFLVASRRGALDRSATHLGRRHRVDRAREPRRDRGDEAVEELVRPERCSLHRSG